MIKLLLLFFLAPLLKSPSCYQYSYILIYIFMLFSGRYIYFCKISYFLGLDSFSSSLLIIRIIISSFIIISILGYSNFNVFNYVNLILRVSLVLIFSSLSFLYIYISFEFVLVPLLVLILGWGYQPERLMAGIYMFFYTVLVSLPLFFLLLIIYLKSGSIFFDYLHLNSDFFLVHFIFVIVFIVKLPIYLVHFWLPKAHVQAPVSGSIILAGLILKIGGYGLIRSIYIYEYMFMKYSYFWFSLSIIGSFLISLICLIQADMKCLIAYSSISHMGLVIIGVITIRIWGVWGSFYLMLGHGFCSSGLFYLRNLVYTRTGRRRFFINKGIIIYLPSCSMAWFLLCSFNISCPPRVNFLREVIILIRIISFWSNSITYFFIISFLCACFSYYLYSFRQHGLFHSLYSFSIIRIQEFMCLFIHLIPLFFITLNMSIILYLSSLLKI